MLDKESKASNTSSASGASLDGGITKVNAPTGIFKKDDKTLTIQWNDGSESDYSLHMLRISCPCAVCVNEWTGQKILDEAKIPRDVRPNRLVSVGRYAMSIHWNDGHKTGIYSYDFLRKLA